MPIVKTSKDEIVKNCIPVINLNGYRNTTIEELAKACKIRGSLFYYYFKDKEELMLEVLKRIHAYFKKKVIVWAYDETLTATERLDKMLEAFESYFIREGGNIMGNTILEVVQFEPLFLPVLQAFFMDFVKAFTHIYEKHLESDIALEKAELTVQDIEGGLLMMRLFQDGKYLKSAVRRAKKLIEHK